MARVSQEKIAEALGLSRTTVTKILNRDPKYSASEETKAKVFAAVEKMGYDLTSVRRPFKREYGRTEINAECLLEIILTETGELFDSGTAIARNIGIGGALLTNLKMPKDSLPISKRFTFRCRILDLPELQKISGECQLVRMTDSSDHVTPEIGVKFVKLTPADTEALKTFIERYATAHEAERLA